MARVSVIVPVVDEEARIEGCLRHLLRIGFHERIVVDGGSRDRTVPLALPLCTQLLNSPCGRGQQLACGARHATGDILLFLHVDCRLPDDALSVITAVLSREGVAAGAFRTRHVLDGPENRWLRPLLPLADLRASYTRLPYGDQALFVWAHLYRRAGGFRPVCVFEDVDLAARLWRQGRIETVDRRVSVSARRYTAHPLRTALVMNTFPTLWRLGISEERLTRWYDRVR